MNGSPGNGNGSGGGGGGSNSTATGVVGHQPGGLERDPALRRDDPRGTGPQLRPRGVITSLSWFPDGSAFVYGLTSVDGCDLYRRTVATGKEKRLTGNPNDLPKAVSLPRLGKARAADGLSVPYWEYVPPARSGGPCCGSTGVRRARPDPSSPPRSRSL